MARAEEMDEETLDSRLCESDAVGRACAFDAAERMALERAAREFVAGRDDVAKALRSLAGELRTASRRAREEQNFYRKNRGEEAVK